MARRIPVREVVNGSHLGLWLVFRVGVEKRRYPFESFEACAPFEIRLEQMEVASGSPQSTKGDTQIRSATA